MDEKNRWPISGFLFFYTAVVSAKRIDDRRGIVRRRAHTPRRKVNNIRGVSISRIGEVTRDMLARNREICDQTREPALCVNTHAILHRELTARDRRARDPRTTEKEAGSWKITLRSLTRYDDKIITASYDKSYIGAELYINSTLRTIRNTRQNTEWNFAYNLICYAIQEIFAGKRDFKSETRVSLFSRIAWGYYMRDTRGKPIVSLTMRFKILIRRIVRNSYVSCFRERDNTRAIYIS